jgi:hypothetical protein
MRPTVPPKFGPPKISSLDLTALAKEGFVKLVADGGEIIRSGNIVTIRFPHLPVRINAVVFPYEEGASDGESFDPSSHSEPAEQPYQFFQVVPNERGLWEYADPGITGDGVNIVAYEWNNRPAVAGTVVVMEPVLVYVPESEDDPVQEWRFYVGGGTLPLTRFIAVTGICLVVGDPPTPPE